MGLCTATVREAMSICRQLVGRVQMQEQGSVAQDFASVAQHGRWYGRHAPSETFVHVIALYRAPESPKGAYLAPSALLRPVHAPSRTARCCGRRGRIGAWNRHKSTCSHPVRSLAALLLAVRADASTGAAIFFIAHRRRALSKKRRSCLRVSESDTVLQHSLRQSYLHVLLINY